MGRNSAPMTKDPSLTDAYALKTPDDHRALYRDWADTYDTGFAVDHDYQLHEAVAQAFKSAGGTGPVLDMGAGTGLVGEALAALGVGPLDASDISPEMLDVAAAKGIYAQTIVADIFKGLPIADNTYQGVTAAGIFTLGHLGPEPLPELLRVAAPGAQFALSIKSEHFAAAGFEAAFEGLKDQIVDLALPEVRIYGANTEFDHAADTALIALFRKA